MKTVKPLVSTEISPKYQNKINILKALVLAFFCGIAAWSVPSVSLAAKNCGGDVYQQLKCKHDAVADQLIETADVAFAAGTKLNQKIEGTARLQHIHDIKEKGVQAQAHNSKERLKKLVKDQTGANKKAGHLVPLNPADDILPNGADGICDYEQGNKDAKCAAIELTASGGLQECNPEKKNKAKGGKTGDIKFAGLECDLSYDSQEPSSDDEAAEMETNAGLMVNSLNAVEEDLITMNDHLNKVNGIHDSDNLAVTAAGCTVPTLNADLSIAVSVLRGLSAAASGAASIVDSASGQTVVVLGSGGNGRAFAVVLDSAALVADLAYITVDEILSDEKDAIQAATMSCLKSLSDDIAIMRAEMHQQFEIINRLLNTPQGLRPSFPTK